MAISTRKAGAIVECATCGEKTLVPQVDIFANGGSGDEGWIDATWAVPPGEAPPPEESKEPADSDSSNAETLHSEHAAVEPSAADTMQEVVEEPFVPADIGDEDGEGGLAIHKHKVGDEEMDLTPMVDVTFQLLIFFMVSASFSLQKTIEVPTPDPDQKGATQQVQTMDDLQGTSILVKIDATNGIWIDDEPLSDPGRLSDTLRDKMRREQKTELLITAHPQSYHRLSIAVIDAANEIGVQKIRMSSQKKTD